MRHLNLLKNYEDKCDMESLLDILIGIYSNPVDYMER